MIDLFFSIEELLKQKFMRSISKISNKGGDDVEQIEEMLHDRLKRRRSTRKSLNKKESMKTVNRVLSKVWCALLLYFCSWLIYLFQSSVGFHIEISDLLCCASEITGFYMKCNTGLNCVNLAGKHLFKFSNKKQLNNPFHTNIPFLYH